MENDPKSRRIIRMKATGKPMWYLVGAIMVAVIIVLLLLHLDSRSSNDVSNAAPDSVTTSKQSK